MNHVSTLVLTHSFVMRPTSKDGRLNARLRM